jgi:hypothetical protein
MVYSYIRGPIGMARGGKALDGDGQRFAAVREVRAYWEALRDDQDLPRREQVNPRGMAGALHQVFMAERVAPGLARFRLAGMDINDLMGMEVRGMPISTMFDPSVRARLAELVEKVVANRTMVELDLEADRGIGRPALQARLLLLPLQGNVGEADLILGCLACEGQVGRAPRRFVIARAVEIVVTPQAEAGTRMHLALPRTAASTSFVARPMPKLVSELAEAKPPRFEGARPPSRPMHLRLVGQDS